jgi:hypothetical protein
MPKKTSPLWLSIPALLMVYAAFGWLGTTWQAQPNKIVILALTTILIDLIAVSPYRLVETLLSGIFGANVRSLFLLMACSTLLIVIFTWLPIVYYALLILVASLLASMDFYGLGWGRGLNFMTLAICQMLGLGIGFGCNIYWWRAVEYWQHLHPS